MARKSPPSTITMRDVARQAGVSVATVSRYLNETVPVSEPASARIAEVLARLHYRPHSVARQLATQQMMSVGLLLDSIYNDFFGPLIYGMDEVVQQSGYNLLVATSRPKIQVDDYPALGPHNVDGLMVFANSLSEQELAEQYRQKLPMVLIHRTSPEGMDIPSVTVENKAATFAVIRHLIADHGHRRIIFMRGKVDQEDSYWREVGYREALASSGIEYDPALVLNGDFERDVAFASMHAFLSVTNHPRFDAVFAGDDSAAIGVVQALQQAGLSIPKDVSVVGFNDSLHSILMNPPLTTIQAPTYEVGRTAATNMLKVIQGLPVETLTLLSTKIILRQSCGCAG